MDLSQLEAFFSNFCRIDEFTFAIYLKNFRNVEFVFRIIKKFDGLRVSIHSRSEDLVMLNYLKWFIWIFAEKKV